MPTRTARLRPRGSKRTGTDTSCASIPTSLDADAFQRLLEEGRQANARDDPKLAADRLRDALALWRGPALADLAYESFAQPEIARLEELRLTALEERIDADLALGRDDELIGELEALVERHPLRERLRGQLMLALYRAGRQAQALQVYQDGRQHLAAELGLEPSESLRRLERQILEQDPELGASSRRTRPAIVPASAWRHPVRIAVAGAVVLALAVGVGAWRLAGGDEAHESAGAIVLDPDTGDTARDDLLRHGARRASPWGRGASGSSTATTRR